MARTKHTGRKGRDQPPLQRATKAYICHRCTKTFTGSNNLSRHLGIIHGVTRDDHPISAEKLATYRSYNAKRGRSKRKTTSGATTSAATTSTATIPRPTTTAVTRCHMSPSSSEDEIALYATPGSIATPPRPDESSTTTEFAATTSTATRTTSVCAATPRPIAVRRIKTKGESGCNPLWVCDQLGLQCHCVMNNVTLLILC